MSFDKKVFWEKTELGKILQITLWHDSTKEKILEINFASYEKNFVLQKCEVVLVVMIKNDIVNQHFHSTNKIKPKSGFRMCIIDKSC